MPLTPGTRLGPYEVTALLGAGGMGEVYRARDLKLNRDVALKVLPPAFAVDPDRLARFSREARLLASLNHPHIAQIYGLEEAEGMQALVLELVEGPTLADRIGRGALAAEEALAVAQQIAEAVEAAHEQGIIHRDLKPANVALSADGTVKVLDFGLAKAMAGGSDAADPVNPTRSISGYGTIAGVILGTAAYMSPEQATGQPVDRRTDIWSFGCMLFEMLTGARPFRGETITETLTAILGGEPDWTRLPPATPPEISRLLHRCLRKDPRQRLQSIGDARVFLGEVVTGTSVDGRATSGVGPSRWRAVWEVAGAALLAATAAAVAWTLHPESGARMPAVSFTIALPAGQRLAAFDRGTLAFSTDGRQLAYVASEAGRQRIYRRIMETGETTPVTGTDGASMPFFSPDGQWLGFFATGRLMKVPLNGGAVTTLTDAPSAYGATWSSDHSIVFASLWSQLERVPDAAGTAPQVLTQFAGEESSHAWPAAVPDQPSVLFAFYGQSSSGIAVADLSSGAHHQLLSTRGAWSPRYAAGHLLYLQAASLMAAPLSPTRQALAGDAALAIPNVRQYAVSADGTLAYASGPAPDLRSRLVWVNRSGERQVIDDRADDYYLPRLDPVRGDRILTDLNGQVWMFDVSTHNFTPFTFGDRNQHAIWTRDGQRVVFMTQKGRTWQLSSQPSDGSGRPVAIGADAGRLDIPYSLAPDDSLAFVKYSGTAESEIWIQPLAGPNGAAAQAHHLSTIPIADAEAGPTFSPDGHWLAYAGNDQTGHRQIYVQAYPGPGGKHQVSIDGGNEPLWNPARRGTTLELFYRNGDDMMAVDVTTAGGFGQGKPRRLFSGVGAYQTVTPNYARANYDVSPDGQRFLMLLPAGDREAAITEIHVVLNWAETLARLAPARR